MADPKMGQFNVTTFREAFKRELRPWWQRLVARQRKVVQEVLSNDLDFFVAKVLKNPQWANMKLKDLKDRPDLMCDPQIDRAVAESISDNAELDLAELVRELEASEGEQE